MRPTLALLILALFTLILLWGTGTLDFPARWGQAPAPSPAQELNRLALERMSGGDFAGALPFLRQAVAAAPADTVLARNLSLALAAAAGNHGPGGGPGGEDREALLREALRHWPENPRALGDLAAVLFSRKRYREALEPARALAALQPGDAEAVSFLALTEERVREGEGMTAERGAGVTLSWASGRRLAFEGTLLRILQSERDDLQVELGVSFRKELEVLLLTPELGERAAAPDPSVGALYDGRIRLFLRDPPPPEEELARTIRHELVHALLFEISPSLPVWLHEALAQDRGERVSRERREEMRQGLRALAAGGWWQDPLALGPSLMELQGEERARAYALSLLFLDHMTRDQGELLVPRLLRALSEGVPLEEAFRSLTGRTPAEWEVSFRREMGGS